MSKEPPESEPAEEEKALLLEETGPQSTLHSQPGLGLREEDRQRFHDWPIWLVSATTFLSGVLGVVQPVLTRLEHHHPKLFSAIVPYEVYHLSKSVTVFFALLLIYLSFNLYHKKRAAWLLSLVINALFAALQFLRIGMDHLSWLAAKFIAVELPSYSCLPPLLGCILLILLRKRFPVKSEVDSIRFAIISSIILCLAAIGYGMAGFWFLEEKDFGINFGLLDSFIRTIREICHFGNADLLPQTRFAKWFLGSLQFVGYITPAFITFSLFRPLAYRLQTLPKERGLALDLLEKFGRTSLDRYLLFPDKSYYFSKDNESFVAYKTAMSVAIALSDPIGPEEKLFATIEGFRAMSNQNGWSCAFMQVTPDYLELYKSAGLSVLKIGEDGIVDLGKFCTETANKKTFKSPTKKMERDGYKVECKRPPQSDATLQILQEISDEWLSLPGRRERGFSLGKFDREELRGDTIFEFQDSGGKSLAFINQVRSYCKDEATIDLMRHRVQVPNGAMDFLFVKLLFALKEDKYKYFSLSLAALSGVGNEADANLHERAVKEIYEHLNRFFSYKGLRKYKEKFDPRWEDRYLIYEGGTPGLVRTALAISKATED